MIYIEAPNEYESKDDGKISLFLAGGITNCSDWQKEIAESLEGTNLVVLNPRRSSFKDGCDEQQILWEWKKLRETAAIMFWFAPETLCPITLFEYGKALVGNKKLFVGCDMEYKRKNDVLIQTRLERPFLYVNNDLEDLSFEIREWYRSVGGSC